MGEARNSPLAGAPVTMRAVVTFFLPIALSVFVVSFIYPIFSWGISRFPQSKDALSAFSIARSLFYIMASPILVLRQTVVALVSDVASYRAIRKFALIVIVGNFLLFLLPGLHWLSPLVFGTIMGVEGSLFTMSRSVYLLFSVAILLNGYSLFLQGLAILSKRTLHILKFMLI